MKTLSEFSKRANLQADAMYDGANRPSYAQEPNLADSCCTPLVPDTRYVISWKASPHLYAVSIRFGVLGNRKPGLQWVAGDESPI